MDNELKKRRCIYCGKTVEKEQAMSVEVSMQGKLSAVFCSAEHMTKHCKRMTRILKKMSRAEFFQFLEEQKNEKK
jgi:hypothetical protein